ncbi:hypothetical protein SAMN05660330_03563 [Desulforhopalus singaporensis]|uniref:Uncharacterized protein n=1 Tax=Desulforhopalus singaporensis TaxID=91360 RepID=A0A1H0UHI3_9BACT|nr:hypothetical protein SAMN05660330_03563 [Desulforhopalus singaporensis]
MIERTKVTLAIGLKLPIQLYCQNHDFDGKPVRSDRVKIARNHLSAPLPLTYCSPPTCEKKQTSLIFFPLRYLQILRLSRTPAY